MLSALITFFVLYLKNMQKETTVSMADISSLWQEGNYQEVYDLTRELLHEKPFHAMALAFNGYSGFYLAVSQTDTVMAQSYLDSAINALRLAALKTRGNARSQIHYMLGKSYFYKNTLSDYHYYSDLAVKYLALAKAEQFEADDIPELLGLSYAALGMTENSIAAFTEALLVRESDILLLSIAEQYYKNSQLSAAKAYLHRISTSTSNDTVRLKSKALLGQIYIDEENYDEAEEEYKSMLEINPNYADAVYGIGVIYEKRGELVKARSEWRKVLRLDVNHQGAKLRLTEYK
jgi:tetratricopeptide (TPR) repeat protein